MTASRTAKLLLAGALGLGSAVTVAAPALADTPPAQQGLVIVLADDDGGFEGPGEIAQPTPAPTPEAPKDKAPGLQQPEPLPGPQPELPIDGGGGHGDPQTGDFPIAGAPEDDGPVVNPDLGEGPGDLTDDPGCTHGCGPDPDPECHPLVAACDLTDREPSDDPGDDEETPDVDEEVDEDQPVEVLDADESRSVLPRTGAGLVALGAAGSALTGLGAALRRLARR